MAPIDRTKILLQTQFVNNALGSKTKYTGIFQTLQRIISEEGVHNLWRGNVVNCIRVAPYAATQFTSYAQYKRLLSKSDDEFTVVRRLLCGGLAGVVEEPKGQTWWRECEHSATELETLCAPFL